MSMVDLEAAFELVEANDDQADFDGTKPEDLLNEAEKSLGLAFPATYRAFLSRFGCGDFAGVEFYGIIKDDFVDSSVPDAIWLTLRQREKGKVPFSLIIVGSTGDGGYYAIDCSNSTGENENPVVEWWEGPQLQREVAKDFGAFFLKSIREALDE